MKKILPFAILLTLASTALGDTLWRQYAFNAAHTSHPAETILNPSNVSQLTFLWKSKMAGTGQIGAGVAAGPVLGFEALFYGFFTDGGRVGALQKQNGTGRWTRPSCSGAVPRQPALGRGIVLVGDAGGDFAGYDPTTGRRLWCNNEGGSITSAPSIAGDSAFITNGEAAVAVDQSSGELRWRFAALDILGIHVTNTPAVAEGVVFVTGDDAVVALDGITGKQIWHRQLEADYRNLSCLCQQWHRLRRGPRVPLCPQRR